MSGIEFVVSEQSKLLDQARDDAIADARRKAELTPVGRRRQTGPRHSITEEGSSRRRGRCEPCAPARFPAPGEQTLRAVVTVSYELGP